MSRHVAPLEVKGPERGVKADAAIARCAGLLRAASTPAEVGVALEALKLSLTPGAPKPLAADFSKATPEKVWALRDDAVKALLHANTGTLSTVDGLLKQLGALHEEGLGNPVNDYFNRKLDMLKAWPLLDKATERSAAALSAYGRARPVFDLCGDEPLSAAEQLKQAAQAAQSLTQQTFAPVKRREDQGPQLGMVDGQIHPRPATKSDDALVLRNEWVTGFSEAQATKTAEAMALRLRLLQSAPGDSDRSKIFSELVNAIADNRNLLVTALLDPRFEQPESWRWVDLVVAPILKKDGWRVDEPEDFVGALRFTGTSLLDAAFHHRPEVRAAVKELWPALEQQALSAAKAPQYGANATENYLTKFRIARWELALQVLDEPQRAKFHAALGLDNENDQQRLRELSA